MILQVIPRLVRQPILMTLAVLLLNTGTDAAEDARASITLSLSEAMALALQGNPQLQTFDLKQRRLDALALQAALKPNPELSLEVENFAGTGGLGGLDGAEYTLAIGQLFERGGKRQRRADVANLNGELLDWDYESLRLDVMEEVGRLFIRLVAAQEHLDLADQLISVAQQDLVAVQLKVEAGSASPLALSRATVAVATAQLDHESFLAELKTVQLSLAATWGAEEFAFSRAAGHLEGASTPPEADSLIPLLERNPDLARWKTEQARRSADLALARALGAVDVTASGGLRQLSDSDDQALVVGISIPLAVHDRNQGGIRAAEYRLDQVDLDRRSDALSLRTQLRTTHAELSAAYREATTLRDRILPEAEQAMTAADDAYRRGLFSFTDVLAVRYTHYRLQGRLVAALARYHTTVAELERLVAGPLNANASAQEQH